MAPPLGYGYPQPSGYPQPGGYPQPSGYTHDDPPGYPAAEPEKREPAKTEAEKPVSRWRRDEDRPARGSNKREDAAFKKATYLVKLDGEGVFDAEGTTIPPVIGG